MEASSMVKTNPASYKLAHQRIAAGLWSIDPERGLLIGRGGKPIGTRTPYGYLEAVIYAGKGNRIGRVYIHRLIWEHAHGPIPEGMQINHRNLTKTDNRLDNLEIVTPLGNVRHAFASGVMNTARGERSGKAKLTNQDVRAIRAALASGETMASVATSYGIKSSTVQAIRDRKTWCHVT
jgi:hypothetical protein